MTPYVISAQSVSVFIGGKPYIFDRKDPLTFGVLSALKTGDPNLIEAAVNEAVRLKALARHLTTTGVTTGRVTFDENTEQLFIDGVPIQHESLVQRLVDLVSVGMDIAPFLKLIANIWANPMPGAREEFYEWFEKANMPITEDGCVLAYKRVRADYYDVHSGTVYYGIGTTATMDRTKVNPDRNQTCAAGLHFCSYDYLSSFSGERVLIVKVNPADIVSIPNDYNYTKGRTWKMTVVGELDDWSSENQLDSIHGADAYDMGYDYDVNY